MTTLIITLPDQPGDASTLVDYVLTDGQNVISASNAPWALLPRAGQSNGGTIDDVVALVDAKRLSWHQVQLPQGTLNRRLLQDGNAQRLRNVLDGLLEDRVLDETTQLHFALAPQPKPNDPVWVAACDRDWLRAGLQALEQAGLPPSRIVPEFAPDEFSDTLHITGEPTDPKVVSTARDGVAIWPLSAAAVALLNAAPDQAIVAEPAVAALAEQLFSRQVKLQQLAQRQVQSLQTAWDLAQFDLVNSSRTRIWKRWSSALRTLMQAPRWRPARVALLALVLVNLAGLNAWAWKEQSLIKAQRTSIQQILTTTFPAVQVVVDPPLQMARAVAALQQANGVPTGRDLESMLAAFGTSALVGSTPSAIEFAAGELRLKGLNLSPDALSQLVFKLKPLGYGAAMERDSLVIKQGGTP
jgi:general secretion pathway protein L